MLCPHLHHYHPRIAWMLIIITGSSGCLVMRETHSWHLSSIHFRREDIRSHENQEETEDILKRHPRETQSSGASNEKRVWQDSGTNVLMKERGCQVLSLLYKNGKKTGHENQVICCKDNVTQDERDSRHGLTNERWSKRCNDCKVNITLLDWKNTLEINDENKQFAELKKVSKLSDEWMNEDQRKEPWKKGWGSERRKIIMEILLNPSCNCRMKIKRETGLKTKHTTLQYKVFGQITRDDGKYSLSKRGDLQITLKTWRLCCHSSPTLSKANTSQSVTVTSSYLTESETFLWKHVRVPLKFNWRDIRTKDNGLFFSFHFSSAIHERKVCERKTQNSVAIKEGVNGCWSISVCRGCTTKW